MAKETFISRYILIIRRLEKGPATFRHISEYLSRASEAQYRNFDISIRTLQRDIRDIREQFGIEIANERHGEKRYYIRSRPENDNTGYRLLEACQMHQAIQETEPFRKVLYFDDRKPIGLEYINGLVFACAHRKIIEFTYHTYWNDNISLRTVHPLALRQALGRWYLVAVDTKDLRLKTFGLDRIDDLDISKTSFTEKYDYDISGIFRNALGVFHDSSQQTQKVVLSVEREQACYLQSYPIHHSQVIVKKQDDEAIVEFHVQVTEDLVMEIMKMGAKVQVLRPASLRKRIMKEIRELREIYA
jgi:predicted DNA-binding transcriptional regulator YafY